MENVKASGISAEVMLELFSSVNLIFLSRSVNDQEPADLQLIG